MISQDVEKRYRKIALIRVQDESAWISCRSIMDNLCEAYSRIAQTHSFFLYSGTPSYQLIEDIMAQDVEVISFVDHRVRLLELLSSDKLLRHIKDKKIKIVIHTFGCFADRLAEYYEAGQLLSGEDVVFVGASPRHVNLINKVMKEPSASLVPFPVDTDSFSFNSSDRIKLREDLGLDENTRLFIYTGRISALKNVEIAMKLLADREQIKFFYLGHFDSYEPLMGQPFIGEMEQINARVKSEVDPNNEWCHHMSFVPHAEMKKYLSAADAYITLATFRGEDFGMSVAEAKSAGLPAFITDWGGLGGFKNLPETYSAKVTLEANDIKIDLSELSSKLDEFKPSNNRDEIASATKDVFGIEAVSKDLSLLLEKSFSFRGMNPKWVFRRSAITTSGFGIISELKDLYEEYSR